MTFIYLSFTWPHFNSSDTMMFFYILEKAKVVMVDCFGEEKSLTKYTLANLDDYRENCLYYYFYMNCATLKTTHNLQSKMLGLPRTNGSISKTLS